MKVTYVYAIYSRVKISLLVSLFISRVVDKELIDVDEQHIINYVTADVNRKLTD